MMQEPVENTGKKTQQKLETGMIIFIGLVILEFGSISGFSPVMSRVILKRPIGSVISSLLILGFILGVMGFLTYSRVSLISGTVCGLVETIMSLFVMLNEIKYLIPAGGMFILAIVGCYYGLEASIAGISEQLAIHSELQVRKTPTVMEVQDLKKHYDMTTHVVKAVDGLNFRIQKGEMVAIMGPSGSGKSTLLNLIGLLDSPTSGKIILDGQDVSKMEQSSLAHERNAKIGFIFQSYNLINRTNVLKNVLLPSIVNPVTIVSNQTKAEDFLLMLGLEEEIHRKPKTLSGGQQQRVAIARALINNPSIILADEPTGNLDSKSGIIVMDILKKLNKEREMTVILVTHDREVASYADRIFYLKDGKIINVKVIPNEIKQE
ncbi:MAG: ABC transporter ATP-binding protein [Candidatus Hodarchaeales archaeon]|jgi:putative ABC transport system ATP-binding protein